VYPAADSRPAVNELQWIQYALDRFATVAELAAAAPAIRVSQAYAKVHYLACDQGSACAAFEYLNGQLTVTQSSGQMPAKALANDTYAASAAYLAKFQGFGGTAAAPTSSSSLDRFVRASILVRSSTATTDSAFQILDNVAQAQYTQWSIVYAISDGSIHFRTRTSPTVKSFSLSSLPVECGAKRKVLDIDSGSTGAVSAQFVDYTRDLNRQLLTRSMASIANQLPSAIIDLLAAYPDTLSCGSSSEGDAPATEAGLPGGEPPPGSGGTKSSSCGCRIAGSGDGEMPMPLGIAAFAAGLFVRRRARRPAQSCSTQIGLVNASGCIRMYGSTSSSERAPRATTTTNPLGSGTGTSSSPS
jgi:hypothetical protein